MSLKSIEEEVRRFLSDPTPEVLCITGKWGVGKTYGWKKFLEESRKSSTLAMKRYSYVSLFGLNSLEDLRFAIFENTVTGDKIGTNPNELTFGQLMNAGNDIARKSRPIVELTSAFFNRKAVSDVLFKSAFLSVNEQIVCLDDLERAGVGLHVRDVLGLASSLKESRGCKVVLLLNSTEHDQRAEFDRQLEKVADTTLVFDLTPEEAVTIALIENEKLSSLLKPRILDLGINNIRVIKKTERLAAHLIKLLEGFSDVIVEQAMATLTLASWSVQQPTVAPSIDFIRNYNRFNLVVRGQNNNANEEVMKFQSMIAKYPYLAPDDFDRTIINSTIAGFFNSVDVRSAAEDLQSKLERSSQDREFVRTWDDLYHGSLSVDDDVFLDALYRSSVDEADAISPRNINSAVRTLREFGREEQANEVVSNYVAARQSSGFGFFDLSRHHFSPGEHIDDTLREAFIAERKSFVDTRDPLAVLISIGERRSWDAVDANLLAHQTIEDYERMFEQLHGDELRRSVETIISLGNSNQESSQAVRDASVAALRRIAEKSPLRARKIEGFGIVLGPPVVDVGLTVDQ